MSKGLAIVTVVNYLSGDAELVQPKNGSPFWKFSIPKAEYTPEGAAERTTWYVCRWYGKRADVVSQWLKKGCHVTVCGEIEQALIRQGGGDSYIYNQVMVSSLNINRYAHEKQDGEKNEEQATPQAKKVQPDFSGDVPF